MKKTRKISMEEIVMTKAHISRKVRPKIEKRKETVLPLRSDWFSIQLLGKWLAKICGKEKDYLDMMSKSIFSMKYRTELEKQKMIKMIKKKCDTFNSNFNLFLLAIEVVFFYYFPKLFNLLIKWRKKEKSK